MATAVDICNMALSLLGDDATLSSLNPPEGSAQADHCARFYGIALQELLTSRPWSFSMRRARLAQLSREAIGEDQVKTFALPSDCAYVAGVFSDEVLRTKIVQYALETTGAQKVLVTTAKDVWIKYVSTKADEASFSPLFVTALVHRLASLLAGAMVPGSTGTTMAGEHIKLYQQYLTKAWSLDARQQARKERYVPRFMGDAILEVEDVFN